VTDIQRGLTLHERIALEEIRVIAIQRVLDGIPVREVAELLGKSKQAVHAWVRSYHAGGMEALAATKSTGAVSKLSKKQLNWLYKTLCSKNPLQYMFDFGLWTRDIIRELIFRRFKVRLAVTSVGAILRKLGLTPQRPLYKAIEQDPERVASWLNKEYPAIRRQAKKAGATIFFADEAGIRSDYHSGTTWGAKGETPIVVSTGSRVNCNMISAVSAQGEMRFMVTTSKVNADVFIDFLKRLMKNAEKPIYLIVDGHPTHRARKTTKYVADQGDMLKLFFLPPYSPELNPDELVWNQIKNHDIGRRQISTKDELVQCAQKALRSLQRCADKIRSCFQSPTTKYALG
jgi:transposase